MNNELVKNKDVTKDIIMLSATAILFLMIFSPIIKFNSNLHNIKSNAIQLVKTKAYKNITEISDYYDVIEYQYDDKNKIFTVTTNQIGESFYYGLKKDPYEASRDISAIVEKETGKPLNLEYSEDSNYIDYSENNEYNQKYTTIKIRNVDKDDKLILKIQKYLETDMMENNHADVVFWKN